MRLGTIDGNYLDVNERKIRRQFSSIVRQFSARIGGRSCRLAQETSGSSSKRAKRSPERSATRTLGLPRCVRPCRAARSRRVRRRSLARDSLSSTRSHFVGYVIATTTTSDNGIAQFHFLLTASSRRVYFCGSLKSRPSNSAAQRALKRFFESCRKYAFALGARRQTRPDAGTRREE